MRIYEKQYNFYKSLNSRSPWTTTNPPVNKRISLPENDTLKILNFLDNSKNNINYQMIKAGNKPAFTYFTTSVLNKALQQLSPEQQIDIL